MEAARRTDEGQTTMGDPERRGGERSEAPRSGGSPIVERETLPTPSGPPPDPEVPARHTRRRFTTKYKLEILRKADAFGNGARDELRAGSPKADCHPCQGHDHKDAKRPEQEE